MSNKRTSGRAGAEEPPVATAATELHNTLEHIEVLTSRVGKLELVNRNEIVRAGELLQKAAEGHKSFLAHLTALTQAVNVLRERQNASADQLSQHAQRVEQRHIEHQQLEQRFTSIGAAARDVSTLMQDSGGGNGTPTEPDREAMGKSLTVAEERLSAAVEEARGLASDAREASFVDLERQADAMRQQLQSLLKKLDEARASLD